MAHSNRREFLSLTAGAAAGALISEAAYAGKKRPNILVILVDDLGYGDLSAYGAPDLKTPNIDALIAEGMRFDCFYANCPVCSPTRASLLTGRYPHRVGVPGVIRTHADNSWGYLDPHCVTLQDRLRSAGYTTALVGKWHLGLESPNKPNQRGFDFFHGFLGDMMDDYFNHRRHGINYMRLDDQEIDPQGHATDLFTDWACDYIRRQSSSSQPFFLYLAYNAPHSPIQPREDWLKRIQQREPHIDPQRAKFGALVEHLDDGVGKVMKTLHDAGLDEKTLVVFSSDNGGRLHFGACNDPLRGEKGALYEGGIRVPTAVRWPGRIPAAACSNRIALTMDIMPTVLDAAGIKVQSEIDGHTFLPTLLGRNQPPLDRDLFFIRREGGAFQGRTIEAIRRGDWKIMRPMPGESLELFNLQSDPREYMNKAGVETRVYAELGGRLLDEMATYDDVPWQPP
ncbi:MAG: sulfatase-like hydrolase/transferase [Candidatus Omnitrophica bacterium]|nr:sulfatase-like hydrolase/transferase [Candidatus Omnitrophota bacterium]